MSFVAEAFAAAVIGEVVRQGMNYLSDRSAQPALVPVRK